MRMEAPMPEYEDRSYYLIRLKTPDLDHPKGLAIAWHYKSKFWDIGADDPYLPEEFEVLKKIDLEALVDA
jgi:hypothetical protein